MINNRQAGRRRGRGGQRPPNNGQGRPDQGNRIDNRARGNAAQLHEKYKTLARDAQMQGDRVNTEYYLQFADHYFRVLNENRARFEDNRRQRDENSSEDEDEGFETRGEDEGNDRQPQYAQQRAPRDDDRNRGQERGDRNGNRYAQREQAPTEPQLQLDAQEQAAPSIREEESAPPAPRRGRPRKVRPAEEQQPAAAIEADRLPPALSREENNGAVSDEQAEAPAPRRRTRRVRSTDGDGEAAAQG